jgi:hypothetical protein
MFTAMAVSEDVLQMGLGLSPVAAAAHAVSVSELVDGALYSGADRIPACQAGVCCLIHGYDRINRLAEHLERLRADFAGDLVGGGDDPPAAGLDHGLDHPSRTVVAGP